MVLSQKDRFLRIFRCRLLKLLLQPFIIVCIISPIILSTHCNDMVTVTDCDIVIRILPVHTLLQFGHCRLIAVYSSGCGVEFVVPHHHS